MDIRFDMSAFRLAEKDGVCSKPSVRQPVWSQIRLLYPIKSLCRRGRTESGPVDTIPFQLCRAN